MYSEYRKVVSFLKSKFRNLAIVVKYEVNVKKWDRGSCLGCLFYIKYFRVYQWNPVCNVWNINGQNITPKCKIKRIILYNYFIFDMLLHKFYLQWEEHISFSCGTMCLPNSTNKPLKRNSNIVMTSFSTLHFLHFIFGHENIK